MNCPNCSHELSDTAKFCDQCGTRRPLEGDEAIALEIANAALVESGAEAMPKFENADERAVGMVLLAKARELLCVPKDEEIARLKAINAEMDDEWKGTIAALNLADEELKSIWDCIGADFRDGEGIGANAVRLIGELRTAAANARREALLTDKDVDALADHITKSRQHWWNDTSIAACVARWIEKRASQPAAETQTHRSGCMCDDCKLEGLQNASDDAWLASQAQPPARDVEGLARVLCERSGDNWGVLDQGEMDDYMADARAVFAHLDGGPST